MMDMNQVMKQAKEMQKKMEERQKNIENNEYVGKSGGGIVEVVLNGKYNMKGLKINSDGAIKTADGELDLDMVSDLVIAAHNDAASKLQKDSKNTISDMMGGMKLPDVFKMPF